MRIPIRCKRQMGVARKVQAVVNRACKPIARTYSYQRLKNYSLAPLSGMSRSIAVRARAACGRSQSWVLPLAGPCTTWRKICNGWSTMHGLWGEPHCGGCIVVINSVKPSLLDKDYSADARASDTAQNQQRIHNRILPPAQASSEARKLRS